MARAKVKVGQVYYDCSNGAYLRITDILEAEVRFFIKRAGETVYTGSYELSKRSFAQQLKERNFIKYSPTVKVLYGT